MGTPRRRARPRGWLAAVIASRQCVLSTLKRHPPIACGERSATARFSVRASSLGERHGADRWFRGATDADGEPTGTCLGCYPRDQSFRRSSSGAKVEASVGLRGELLFRPPLLGSAGVRRPPVRARRRTLLRVDPPGLQSVSSRRITESGCVPRCTMCHRVRLGRSTAPFRVPLIRGHSTPPRGPLIGCVSAAPGVVADLELAARPHRHPHGIGIRQGCHASGA